IAGKIKLGTRHRKDLGDVRALARDFNERGLLHPIVVSRRNELIAGERRLAAWQHPDHIRRDAPIPVTIVPLAYIVAGEWAENDPQLRKDFTPSETVAIVRALRPVMASAARERQRAAGRSKASVKFTEAEKGDAREKVAKAT